MGRVSVEPRHCTAEKKCSEIGPLHFGGLAEVRKTRYLQQAEFENMKQWGDSDLDEAKALVVIVRIATVNSCEGKNKFEACRRG